MQTIQTTLKGRDVIAASDFSKEEILHILSQAKVLKENGMPDLLKGKILGSCFFEPSTRTRLSFESAMHRLGGQVVGFSEGMNTSTKKGETLHDTMKMMENYADLIVVRHPLQGASQLAADAVSVPVINAGDGANEHPTQTFLDLFTILETQGTLEGLNIALVGDLKNGRTVHSLAQALTPFKSRLYLVSPPSLEMPKHIRNELRGKGVKFSFHKTYEEVLPKLDILYMTRIQEERFTNKAEYQQVKDSFRLAPEAFIDVKENLKIMHPLPRGSEIDPRLDETRYGYYFEQAKNGVYTRQALLGLILGELE